LRLKDIIQQLWDKKDFSNKKALDIGRLLAHHATADFAHTKAHQNTYGALVAFPSTDGPSLCEFGVADFQPELKELENIWFASMGSAEHITDSIILLLRDIFWTEKPPTVEQGAFLAVAALEHAIRINPGGVNGPIQVAVLEARKPGQFHSRELTDAEIGEHANIVGEAYKHFSAYSEKWKTAGKAALLPNP